MIICWLVSMSISMTSTAGEGLLLIHRKWEVLIKETTLPHTHTQSRELTHSKCVWLMFEIALLLLLLLRSICLMTADLSPPTLVIHIFSNCGPPVKILLPLFLFLFFFQIFISNRPPMKEEGKRRNYQWLKYIDFFFIFWPCCHVKLKWGRQMERRIFSLFFYFFFQRLHSNFLRPFI